MKQIMAVLTALLLLGVLGRRAGAETQLFVIQLHGTIQTDASPRGINVNNHDFVAPTNRLVAVVDTVSNTIDLVEMPPNSITPVRTLLVSDHTAFFGGNLSATLEGPSGNPPLTLNNLLVFGGELMLTGKTSPKTGSPKTFAASLVGIWNDHVSGVTNAPSAVFKGVITGKVPR